MVFRYRNVFPMYQLRDEMDRLLSGFFGQEPDGDPAARWGSQPAVNVWESEDSLMVEVEIPGVRKDEVDISVVGDELSLKVQRPDVAQDEVIYHRRERPVGSFTRVLRLPVEVDAEHVEAELADGVLTISLPKAPSAKPRKINVVAAS
jgi:HSP20 family protein